MQGGGVRCVGERAMWYRLRLGSYRPLVSHWCMMLVVQGSRCMMTEEEMAEVKALHAQVEAAAGGGGRAGS